MDKIYFYLLLCLLLVSFVVNDVKKYKKPKLSINTMFASFTDDISEEYLPPHQDDDCECDGITSITFQYNDLSNGLYDNIKITVSGKASSSHFEYVYHALLHT